ncbi:MAG: tyrosine-type recombinase/integrase [Phycisphaerales bacterium]|nr:tyrosine-type recombinase/integrase [Phycisphaerales bacterium]
MKQSNDRQRAARGCVFKPVVIDHRGGRKRRRRGGYYWAKYRDDSGRVVRRALKLSNGKGIADKAVAEAELRRLITRMERQAAGLVDAIVESARMPIRVVIARYARHLRALRRTREHVFKTIQRAKWLMESAGVETLGGLNAASVSVGLDTLAGRNRAPKTINEYRAVAFGMCQWAVKVVRILDRNPIGAVPVRDSDADKRKVRRAMTIEEAGRLLAVSGPRSLWYETALFTGLRVRELQLLAWGDLVLDDPRPRIELRASTTKARRADFVPLKRSLAIKLGNAKPSLAAATDRVFRTAPTRATFRRDCTRAGISYEADDRGRTLDRRALRTSFVTWLSMSGVDPRTAQQLARHTDIELTMRVYTDPRLIDTSTAIERLPTLDPDEAVSAKATGTYGANVVVPPVVPTAAVSRPSLAIGGVGGSSGTPAQRLEMAIVGNEKQGATTSRKIGGGGNRTPVP